MLPGSKVDSLVQRFERLVATIGIAGIIRLAHAAHEVADAAPEGQRRRERKEQQVAGGHESVRQAIGAKRYFGLARERRIAHLAKDGEIEDMIGTKPWPPSGEARRDGLTELRAAFQLDAMPLAVSKTQRLDMAVAGQRPRQARGGILPAGEQDERLCRIIFRCQTHVCGCKPLGLPARVL